MVRLAVPDAPSQRAAYDALHAGTDCTEGARLYRWVLGLMGPRRGDTILDVACGRGGLVLAARAAGLQAVGVDVSVVALRRGPRGVGVLADGEALPFPTGSFRRVANLGGLEHFLDPARGAREMARVAAPGGRVWVMLPNAYYSGAIWTVVRTGRGPDHHQPVDRFATCQEWRDLLEGAGLRVLRVIAYNKFKWWKRLLPFHLAWHFLYECEPCGPSAT